MEYHEASLSPDWLAPLKEDFAQYSLSIPLRSFAIPTETTARIRA